MNRDLPSIAPLWLALIAAAATGCVTDNKPSYAAFDAGLQQWTPIPTPEAAPEASVENFDPPCALTTTLAGDEIKKGTACTADDVQLCYRHCGPQSVGWKSETCTAGVYAEGDCQFPSSGDYSCFSIPSEIDMSVCPAQAPQASADCDVPECTLCNLNGQYFDSKGNNKVGYCICQPPSGDAGTGSWTCASATAWPCPLGNGC